MLTIRLIQLLALYTAALNLFIAPVYAETERGDSKKRCDRIVSLAPSVTELLFELGLGERIVGVTKFCRYPRAAFRLPKVGGYLDLNLERVVSLEPTVVFGLSEGASDLSRLSRFKIAIERLEHRTLIGIKESYERVSAVCGLAPEVKDELLARLKRREEAISSRCSASARRERFAIVVGRGSGGVFYLSGSDGYYGDVVRLLGGVNVNSGVTVGGSAIGFEGLRKLRPSVVVEVRSVDDVGGVSRDKVSEWWRGEMGLFSLGWNGMVVVLDEDYASVPGPRYIELAERLAGEVC